MVDFPASIGSDDLSALIKPNRSQRQTKLMNYHEALSSRNQRRIVIVDNATARLSDRLSAYLEIAGDGQARYRRGNEIPTLTQLAKYVRRDRTSVGDIRKASNVNREVHDILLGLAGIYPPPAPGQSPAFARKHRLAVADDWLEEPSDALLDRLVLVINRADDFNYPFARGA